MSKVFEGTCEEIVALLKSDEYAGRNLRVIIEIEAEDPAADRGSLINFIRDFKQLEERLMEGINPRLFEMSLEEWEEMRRQVEDIQRRARERTHKL